MTKKKRPHSLAFNDKHLTKQDHGGSADINYIAQQYLQGHIPIPENPPQFYGDIAAVDIHKSREILATVNSTFAELPSDVRDHFKYDPARYVSFIDDHASAIDSDGFFETVYNEVNPIVPEPEQESAQNAEENLPPGTKPEAEQHS